MATPTYPSKRFFVAGSRKGSAWGTAVALGATYGVLIEGDGNPSLKQDYVSDEEIGQPMPLDGSLGLIKEVDFSPEFTMRYDPGVIGSWIAALFGTAGAPAQQGATTAYKHIFQWADSAEAFFTFGVEKPGTIVEVASCIPTKLTLKISGGKLKGVVAMRGNTVVYDSATNGATQMDAITYIDRANRIRSVEGALWMNAQSGDALDSGDALEASDIEITYERSRDAEHAIGSDSIILPKDKSWKISVKVTLPRTSAANLAYFATFKAMTAQKMSLVFTSPSLAGVAYYYSLGLFFPRLKFVEPPAAPLADVMNTVLNFEAEEAASAPTGMTYTRPFAELMNKATADYLA